MNYACVKLEMKMPSDTVTNLDTCDLLKVMMSVDYQ